MRRRRKRQGPTPTFGIVGPIGLFGHFAAPPSPVPIALARTGNHRREPQMPLTRTAAGLAAVALLIGATGCSKPDTAPAAPASTSGTAAPALPSLPPVPSGAEAPPIVGPVSLTEFAKANGLTATPLRHGQAGPTVELPTMDGWTLSYDLPEAPFGALVFDHPSDPDIPGRVLVTMTKLSGPVERDAVFAATGNELRALPNFQGPATGQSSKLDGYVADQVGGLYGDDGRLVAQKTVVIPAGDVSYVLQVRASGSNQDAAALMSATADIDKKTVITE